MFQELHVLGMNDNLWDRVRGLGSEACYLWKAMAKQSRGFYLK